MHKNKKDKVELNLFRMAKFQTPKLLITDHYDEVIRQVDIHIEELLEKYKEEDLLPIEAARSNIGDDDSDDQENFDSDSDWDEDTINKIDGLKDPYQSKFKYDMNKLLRIDVSPGTTRVRDYLELVRTKAIEEIKKAEQYNLDNYELNKDLYKYDRQSLTDEKVEEIRQNLFKDKFAFVVVNTSKKSVLKFHTILTDFYLDENDLTILKRHFQRLKNLTSEQIDEFSRDIINEKCLFLHLVSEYVIGLTENYDYGTEIIEIRKSSLFRIDRINIEYMKIDHVDLPLSTPIDFSFIKSLKLDTIVPRARFYITDLSGLRQLEYLEIVEMSLKSDSLNGLDKLINLQLIECFLPGYKLCFDSLKSLQILKIVELYFPIELKSLENLKVLIIENIRYLELIMSESITYLNLSDFKYSRSNPDEFFSRLCLPNLFSLNMSHNRLPHLKENWFKGSLFLKELVYQENDLENLDFCRFDYLAQVEKLDLSANRIEKLDESAFSINKLMKRIHNKDNNKKRTRRKFVFILTL